MTDNPQILQEAVEAVLGNALITSTDQFGHHHISVNRDIWERMKQLVKTHNTTGQSGGEST